MAAQAHLVRKNFVWRIEAVTPTETTLARRASFTEVDPLRIDPEQSSGYQRAFSVQWQGSEGDQLDDLLLRQQSHMYAVEVYYSTKLKYDDLHDIILQDRHDITKTLRNPSNVIGYSDAQSSTDIGVGGRWFDSDEIVREDNLWTYRAMWRVTITETET